MIIFIKKEFENVRDKLEALGYIYTGMGYSLSNIKISHISSSLKELRDLGIEEIEIKALNL